MSDGSEHDDGLVHSHSWARDEVPPHAAVSAAARPAATMNDRRRHRHAARTEQDHDDGLVHDHGWARGERLGAAAAE